MHNTGEHLGQLERIPYIENGKVEVVEGKVQSWLYIESLKSLEGKHCPDAACNLKQDGRDDVSMMEGTMGVEFKLII